MPDDINFPNTLLPVSSNIYSRQTTQQFSLYTILKWIKFSNKLRSHIEKIRNTLSETSQKQLKLSLPQFYPACNQLKYKKFDDNEKIKSSGLFHFDLDCYDGTAISLRKQLIEIFPSLVYAFLSPRGGLKFALGTDFISSDKTNIQPGYKAIYKQLSNCLLQKFPQLKIDNAVGGFNHSCFFSYDPELYFNPLATPIKTASITPIKPKQLDYAKSNYINNRQDIENALEHIPAYLPYDERLIINFAVISELGEQACTLLLNHWRVENPNKLRRDILGQISYARNNTLRTSLSSLFYVAKKYGYTKFSN